MNAPYYIVAYKNNQMTCHYVKLIDNIFSVRFPQDFIIIIIIIIINSNSMFWKQSLTWNLQH